MKSMQLQLKKGNDDLKNQVDKVIDKMKKDGRYQELLKKYFGERGKE